MLREFLRRLFSSWLVLRVLEVMDLRTENRMTEFGVIAQAFKFKNINKVERDYFEFGLWRGKDVPLCSHRAICLFRSGIAQNSQIQGSTGRRI